MKGSIREAFAPMVFPAITLSQLQAYAKASGDSNPIHVDEAAARGAGLPGIIAHGMLTAGLIAEHASVNCPVGFRLSRIDYHFRGMTLLGDAVTVSGGVRERTGERVMCEFHAQTRRGDETTSAVAEYERIPNI
ncbi:MaoC/PaaZ C-terminal domain-containing protein [Bdellovibrionota bacterium FG-2]